MEESSLSKSRTPSEKPDCKGLRGAERHRENDGDGIGSKEEACDVEVWDTLSSTFVQVQSVLDQNRSLIQRVNENHQSKIPDNLAKNVLLIQEINDNISKVLVMYSDLSTNFSTVVHQRRSASAASKTDQDNGGSDHANDTAERGEN